MRDPFDDDDLPVPVASPPAAPELRIVARPDRDSRGLFLKGHGVRSPGRPQRPNLWTVAAEHAAADGIDLHARLWRVVLALLDAAEAGDVAAAKLLLDKLTDNDPLTLRVVNELSDTERTLRLQAILAQAAARTGGSNNALTD